jgi:hypothetical protein
MPHRTSHPPFPNGLSLPLCSQSLLVVLLFLRTKTRARIMGEREWSYQWEEQGCLREKRTIGLRSWA